MCACMRAFVCMRVCEYIHLCMLFGSAYVFVSVYILCLLIYIAIRSPVGCVMSLTQQPGHTVFCCWLPHYYYYHLQFVCLYVAYSPSGPLLLFTTRLFVYVCVRARVYVCACVCVCVCGTVHSTNSMPWYYVILHSGYISSGQNLVFGERLDLIGFNSVFPYN